MKPVIAHKGRLSIQVEARGAPGHSSNPGQGVNAVQEAARAVLWLADEARRFAVEGPFEDGFEPPHTTVHVGNFHGGTALNIIPELARFAAEWRTIPADDAEREFARLRAYVAERIEPGMKAVRADCGFRFEVEDWLPGLSLPSDHALTAMVKQLTGSNSVGKVSYGTEAGVYQQSGIAAIVCGPGNIAQAHQPDEWIAESELAACDAFIRRLAARLAAP
jgi:acetylornithine deacetylase